MENKEKRVNFLQNIHTLEYFVVHNIICFKVIFLKFSCKMCQFVFKIFENKNDVF